MNILINDSDMPKSCNDCAMKYMNIGYDYECVFTNDYVGDCIEHRLANCPLKEARIPHGKLIDADAAVSRLRHLYCDGCGCDCSTCPWGALSNT